MFSRAKPTRRVVDMVDRSQVFKRRKVEKDLSAVATLDGRASSTKIKSLMVGYNSTSHTSRVSRQDLGMGFPAPFSRRHLARQRAHST